MVESVLVVLVVLPSVYLLANLPSKKLTYMETDKQIPRLIQRQRDREMKIEAQLERYRQRKKETEGKGCKNEKIAKNKETKE